MFARVTHARYPPEQHAAGTLIVAGLRQAVASPVALAAIG